MPNKNCKYDDITYKIYTQRQSALSYVVFRRSIESLFFFWRRNISGSTKRKFLHKMLSQEKFVCVFFVNVERTKIMMAGNTSRKKNNTSLYAQNPLKLTHWAIEHIQTQLHKHIAQSYQMKWHRRWLKWQTSPNKQLSLYNVETVESKCKANQNQVVKWNNRHAIMCLTKMRISSALCPCIALSKLKSDGNQVKKRKLHFTKKVYY